MQLFNRRLSVLIGVPGTNGVLIDQTTSRIKVSARRSHSKSPNEATVMVWGLKDSTIESFKVPGAMAVLSAGYGDSEAVFFSGQITRVESYLDNVDVVAEISVRDSVIALRDAKVQIGVPRGASAMQVLNTIVSQFGLPVRRNINIPDVRMPRGYSFHGRARNAMDDICKYLGLEWSAQTGEIQLLEKGGVYASQAVELTPETGLVGSPKPEAKSMTEKAASKAGIKYGQDGVGRYVKTDPTAKVTQREMRLVEGYNAKSLFNAAIYPGSLIKLISRGVPGVFLRVEQCSYDLDTHESDFIMSLTLRYPKEAKQLK